MTTTTKTKWSHPTPVSDMEIAFPARALELMPTMEEIPEEFRRFAGTEWNRWAEQWFFRGLKGRPKAKRGIDGDAAMRHLRCVQASFEPKHEHKDAAVAYLASLWFKEPTP